jgi:signal transduction histidine kinase
MANDVVAGYGGPERVTVSVVLCRAVVTARTAAAMTAAAAQTLVAGPSGHAALVLALLGAIGSAQAFVLTRWPLPARYPTSVVGVDALLSLIVLATVHGGPVYFAYAAGAAALAGTLLGPTAWPLWAGYLGQGYAVVAVMLHRNTPPPPVATFLLATPLAVLLAGLGAAVMLSRQIRTRTAVAARAQQAATATERTRLARELHDSVLGTLRGISLAALTLPGSLHRSPNLAEQLAATIADGADTAARQARDLVTGLRLDAAEDDFATTLRRLCGSWSTRTGIPVNLTTPGLEPSADTRYELIRIIAEALANVERHARATTVTITVTAIGQAVHVAVHDDGAGFDPAAHRPGRLGILGMRERAHSLGGELAVTSIPGSGTEVRARIPLAGTAR